MSMDFTNFQQVFAWVIAHGYPLMFLAMCIEGPTVTAAATFGATLGYFNPLVIFILSVLGDVIPDAIYYGIGFWGRIPLVKRFGKKFGISQKKLEKMEKRIKLHGGKMVAVLKYTPVLSTPGLMMVGAMRMNWWKYLWFVFIVTLQKTLTFMALGYFFGRTYDIGKYIKLGAIVPFAIVFIYVVVAWLYKRYSAKITGKIEKF